MYPPLAGTGRLLAAGPLLSYLLIFPAAVC